jgi:hypothetical protein
VKVGSFYTCLFGVVYVTCGDFRDGSEKGTESVHQILCHYWEKYYGDPQNDVTRLRGPKLESCTGGSVVYPVQDRSHISYDDDEHTGRPASCTAPETVAQIQQLSRQDRRWTVRDVAEEVGVGYGTSQRVLTEELGMHRVAAKFVPRILTDDQKQQRVDVCTALN